MKKQPEQGDDKAVSGPGLSACKGSGGYEQNGRNNHYIRYAAYVVLSLDLLLFLYWIATGIFPVAVQCPDGLLEHILILLHFQQTAAIASVLDEWNEEIKHCANIRYSPYAWIVPSLIALCGDIFLLLINFVGTHPPECDNAKDTHIFLDSAAIIICIISVTWFMVVFVLTGGGVMNRTQEEAHVSEQTMRATEFSVRVEEQERDEKSKRKHKKKDLNSVNTNHRLKENPKRKVHLL